MTQTLGIIAIIVAGVFSLIIGITIGYMLGRNKYETNQYGIGKSARMRL